uniref:Capsid protein n=1 Tax=Wuhan asiatic toad astrovirus TaxID=2116422 RepID=A0A2P1GMF6_9VIRU|nr:capsid protein [Wuhan asiatic toad astrovirus]
MPPKQNKQGKVGLSQPNLPNTQKRKRRKKKNKGPNPPHLIGGVKQKLDTLQRQVKAVKEKTDGPKVQKTFTVTLDLGYIQPCTQSGLEKSITILTSPALLKGPRTGAVPTPLSVECGQYQLWRIQSFELQGFPMVGSSAVAGSSTLLTLVEDAGTTGEVTLDTIFLRHHLNVVPGSRFRWKLPTKALQGPKSGWWYMEPDREQTTSLGSRVEVWSFGITQSTYQSKPWDGPLWRLQCKATYNFSSYSPDPPLSTLEHSTQEDAHIVVTTDAEGDAVMQITHPQGNRGGGPYAGRNDAGLGDAIWGIADNLVAGVASVPIPGWSWLVDGAWSFIKKIVGKDLREWARANPTMVSNNPDPDYYRVYASLDDARTNQPWKPPTGGTMTYTWQADVDWFQLSAMRNAPQNPLFPSSIQNWPVASWRMIEPLEPLALDPDSPFWAAVFPNTVKYFQTGLTVEFDSRPWGGSAPLGILGLTHEIPGDSVVTSEGGVFLHWPQANIKPPNLVAGDLTSMSLYLQQMRDTGQYHLRAASVQVLTGGTQFFGRGAGFTAKVLLSTAQGVIERDCLLTHLEVDTPFTSVGPLGISYGNGDHGLFVLMRVDGSPITSDDTLVSETRRLMSIRAAPPPTLRRRGHFQVDGKDETLAEDISFLAIAESDDESSYDDPLIDECEKRLKHMLYLADVNLGEWSFCPFCRHEHPHDFTTCLLMRNPHRLPSETPFAALAAHTSEKREVWLPTLLQELGLQQMGAVGGAP